MGFEVRIPGERRKVSAQDGTSKEPARRVGQKVYTEYCVEKQNWIYEAGLGSGGIRSDQISS